MHERRNNMARRKKGLISKILTLFVIGLAVFGGYKLLQENQKDVEKVVAKVKNVGKNIVVK